MIEFRTLGAVRLGGAGASGIGLQPKVLALLAYLASEPPGVPIRRDALVGLLWPEVDQTRARNALSQALHRLRRTLPGGTIVSRGNEEIELAADRIRCDAAELRAAAADGRPAMALRLYGGDYLHGFHLSHAAEFERWLDDSRASYRRLAFDAATALAEGAVRAREPVEAERWLRRALEIDPLSRDALARLVRHLIATGDRAGAAQTFEGFSQRLSRDLGVRLEDSMDELSREPSVSVAIPVGNGNGRPRVGPEAHRAYVRGLHFRGTFSGTPKAIECFGTAIGHDPAFAAAHAGLALCLGAEALLGHLPPGAAHARMRAAVGRALELEPDLLEAHVARGVLRLYFERDWSGANAALRRAVALRPDDAQAHAFLAAERAIAGAHAEAVAHAERAVELAPLDPWTNFMLGWVRYRARDWAGSLAQLRDLLQLYPHYALAHVFVGEAHLAGGCAEQAAAACEEALALLPREQLVLGIGACVIGLAGRRERALVLRERLEELGREGYVDPLYRAAAAYGAGDAAAAIATLEAAEREVSATIHLIAGDPLYDGLKDSDRFRGICRRLGLAG